MESIRSAIERASGQLAEHPEAAAGADAPAIAVREERLRFSVHGPSGELITDMAASLGGGGGAPSPGWLLRAALSSCTATVIAMRAARLGIALDTLEVTVESESDNRGLLGLDDKVSAGLLGLRTAVRIGAANADAEQLREIVRWADEHSPIACTLRQAREMGIDVEVV